MFLLLLVQVRKCSARIPNVRRHDGEDADEEIGSMKTLDCRSATSKTFEIVVFVVLHQ
jgi:hypothetical protein